MSRDGLNFSKAGVVTKTDDTNKNYFFAYEPPAVETGIFFFRIKQKYVPFSSGKSAELQFTANPIFIMFPNPSSGIGIKFDNIHSDKIVVLIINAQGQIVVRKELAVNSHSYRQIALLQRGIYWLRLKDVTSHLSCVNQLFIK